MHTYSFQADEILKLQFKLRGQRSYEIFCFGIDREGRFDRDCSVFDGQKRVLDGALTFSTDSFEIILSHLPEEIRKLIFVVHPMNLNRNSNRSEFLIRVAPVASKKFELRLDASDFAIDPSRANVIADLSRTFSGDRQNWRLRFFSEEFNGLAQIRRTNLQKDQTRSILVLDLSPDSALEEIQKLSRRILPELIKLDSNSEIDYYTYASRVARLIPINLSNFFINVPPPDISSLGLGTKNDPYVAMEQILDDYQSTRSKILVTLVTNGEFHDSKWVRNLLIDSQTFPIFWNFLGIGGRSLLTMIFGSGGYKHLKKFAELPNVSFESLDDFASMKDWEIRNCIRKKFLQWLSRK